jgi:REP element-mobilizing transposase RayT
MLPDADNTIVADHKLHAVLTLARHFYHRAQLLGGLTPRRSPGALVQEHFMDRFWFLTNTLYGNWLPGHWQGFVGHVREHRPDDRSEDRRIVHDIPGTPYDEQLPELERAARARMIGPPIHLTLAHAEVALAQFQETARHRQWSIEAVAIMFNHFHIVVGVPGDPEPGKILGDFKSWCTRKLSQRFGKPSSETWWTERGSKRKLADERALLAAIDYVLYKQPNPLLTWSPVLGLNPVRPPEPRIYS